MRARPSSFPAWLAAAHDAVLIADEAHALGVAGPGGRGLLTAHAHHTDEELAPAAKVLRRVVPGNRR